MSKSIYFFKDKSFLFILLLTFFFLLNNYFKFPFGNSIIASLNQVQENKVEGKLQAKSKIFSLKINNVSKIAGDWNKAKSYIVVDQDLGEIIAEKNSTRFLPIASLTKIMTAVVALDLANPDEEFKISKTAARMPATKIGVVPNQKMTLEELLNALLLTSANDAAQVIKEGIDSKYQSKVFVKAMNEKARILGLNNTSFANPQGFDSANNYSSSHDLAVLSNFALSNYPLIAEIAKKQYEFIPKDGNHKLFDLYNWNGLLGVYPGATGLKIGNTARAGATTIVTAQREEKKILVVLLGAPDIVQRDLWASQLLDLAFRKTADLAAIGLTEDDFVNKYSSWKPRTDEPLNRPLFSTFP